jgi:hypothetical protein
VAIAVVITTPQWGTGGGHISLRILTAKAGPICQKVRSIDRDNPAYPNFNEEWTLGEFTLGSGHNLHYSFGDGFLEYVTAGDTIELVLDQQGCGHEGWVTATQMSIDYIVKDAQVPGQQIGVGV